MALLCACRPSEVETADSDPPPEPAPGKIAVVFTADTLGAAAAKETGWCERIQEIAGRYGLTAACPDGAVSPSSWTPEAHTRVLWPQHTAGPLRGALQPVCGERSVLREIADDLGGSVVFAADNPVLGDLRVEACPDGVSPWHQGADFAYDADIEGSSYFLLPPEERSLRSGVDRIVSEAAERPVAAFLNAFEVGGHFPRCFRNPGTPSCAAAWDLAVTLGLADAEAEAEDRSRIWLGGLHAQMQGRLADFSDRESELRPIFWGTTLDAIAETREPYFEGPLDRLLSGLRDAGRLQDLTLVILGDHGENPCVARPLGAGLSCAHGGLPTPWTANVPVAIVPSEAADRWVESGLVGDAGLPWSTANLAFGLLERADTPVPESWPPPTPLGYADSWACERHNESLPAGARVIGDRAVLCRDDACTGMEWQVPPDPSWIPARSRADETEAGAWASELAGICGNQ